MLNVLYVNAKITTLSVVGRKRNDIGPVTAAAETGWNSRTVTSAEGLCDQQNINGIAQAYDVRLTVIDPRFD